MVGSQADTRKTSSEDFGKGDFVKKVASALFLSLFVLLSSVQAETDIDKVYCCVKGCGG